MLVCILDAPRFNSVLGDILTEEFMVFLSPSKYGALYRDTATSVPI
jgi:hypothetical protein